MPLPKKTPFEILLIDAKSLADLYVDSIRLLRGTLSPREEDILAAHCSPQQLLHECLVSAQEIDADMPLSLSPNPHDLPYKITSQLYLKILGRESEFVCLPTDRFSAADSSAYAAGTEVPDAEV